MKNKPNLSKPFFFSENPEKIANCIYKIIFLRNFCQQMMSVAAGSIVVIAIVSCKEK